MRTNSETPVLIFEIQITNSFPESWYSDLIGTKMMARVNECAGTENGVIVRYPHYKILKVADGEWSETGGNMVDMQNAVIVDRYVVDAYFREDSLLHVTEMDYLLPADKPQFLTR